MTLSDLYTQPRRNEYRPVKGPWLVQVRHGSGWRQYPMPIMATTDVRAAREVRAAWGRYEMVRVKAAECGDKWRRIRFVRA